MSAQVDRLSVIERTQADRDAEAKAFGFVASPDEITQAERRGYCKGWDAAIEHSTTIKRAVDRIAILETALDMAADDAERFTVEQYVAMAEQKLANVYGWQ